MSNSKVLLSFSLFFFFNSFASSSSFNATHKCSPQQTLDLLLFKENLSSINHSYNNEDFFDYSCQDWLGSDYYYPIMMNWNKNTDCCKWDGVTCRHFSGDVIGIDLSCGMLRGTIHPNTTLFHLPHLQTLNLAYNDFSDSQLPHKLSNTLTHLNISQCGFIGEISHEILYFPGLVSLDLSWNGGLKMQPYIVENLLQNSTRLRELLIVNVKVGWVLPPYLNISSLQSLDLSYTHLQGKLPDNIFNLQYLENLDLSNNNDLSGVLPKVNTSINIPLKWLSLSFTNLSGGIHYSIGHLKSLNYLGLSSCGLVGSVPKSLVNLRHLTTLYLSDNELNGTLPSLLFTLPLLEYVYLHNNMFSGGLPSEFYNCRSLKILLLFNNQFDGEINHGSTSSFIKLVNLTFLDLSFNNFKGVWYLDTLFSSLPNLQSLYLSYSGLSIVVYNNLSNYVNPDFRSLGLASCKVTLFPESLRGMKNLRYLDLSDNDIHGHIPHWAGEIGGNGLSFLDLSNNSITGLPQFQWDGVEKMYLQSNKIQGPFPQSICNMWHLFDLDISNNFFSGVIPQCLGNITSLGSLNVKSNQIQGPFPLSICNMSHLTFLDMSYNSFDGVIPQCLGDIISTLGMVNMRNNRFHGIIPNVFDDCVQLEGFILNGNQLQGEIPSSLSKCQYLKVLDLGNNQLKGTFPRWSGDLAKLQVLVLKSNKLHGPIETYSTNENTFPSMRVLDLSDNTFEGILPRIYFQNFNAMKIVEKKSVKPKYMSTGPIYYSMIVAMKGVDQKFPQILMDYTIIDLSNNKFEGGIPGVIGGLTSLIVLNLSHNNLTGQIPYDLGNLSEIESLDLSWNQLTGEIPQSLAHLTFLGFLNLSQNHLVGRIPSGTQFGTFETSFVGNPELCGLPLPKKCEHPLDPQLEIDGDGDGDGDWKSGFTWRVVMMGYGCGIIIGLVLGYLMLSTGRPKWLNAIVDVGEHMIRTRKNRRRYRYVYIGK